MTWKPSYLTREQMEERRRKGGRLLKSGKISQAEISRQLGVSRTTVSDRAKTIEAKVETLEHVQRQLPGKIILIWDRASIHLSKITNTYLHEHPEILIEELPAYAPKLNPEEYCHGNVKQHLRNARPGTKEEIRSMLNRGFARLRRRPDLLLGFFHAAGLFVKQLRFT